MFPNDNDFESQFTFETPGTPLPDEPPFHVLFLGDWSGGGSQVGLPERRPIVIDRDNFDEVIRRLNVRLELDLYGDQTNLLALEFTELDDFHPDNLFRRVSLFSDLRDVRRRLSNSDTFYSAANEVRSWFDVVDENMKSDDENHSQFNDSSQVDSSNLLDMIISQPTESSTSAKPQKVDNTDLGRLISKIVSPFLIKIDENEQSKLVAAVDEATGELMRRILHHPQFQALESAWRGLYFLVKRLETDVDLKVFILDVSKNELSNNLKSINNLVDSIFYDLLTGESIETSGGTPWAIIAGNYSFGLNVDDVAALMRIGKLSSAANAPFISHIRPEMFGMSSFAFSSELNISETTTEGKLWNALRNLPESNYFGFSPMRFLVRLPYGEATDSVETFSFEEFTDQIDHEQYLWANPCFICTFLLAQSFRLFSWEMGKALQRDVEKLPLYIYRENGEPKSKPCAEIVLTENSSEKILEQGLMPLISFRDSDRIRLARFQSISTPPTILEGRWNR